MVRARRPHGSVGGLPVVAPTGAIVYLPQVESSRPSTTLLAEPPRVEPSTYAEQATITPIKTLHHHSDNPACLSGFLSSIVTSHQRQTTLAALFPSPRSPVHTTPILNPTTPILNPTTSFRLKRPRRAKQTRKWYPHPRSTYPTKTNQRYSPGDARIQAVAPRPRQLHPQLPLPPSRFRRVAPV